MMIQAVLGNPHHPEYGVATIPFPIPRDQHAHCMDMLQLDEAEFELIQRARRGECLYKCGMERYHLEVKAPPHKAALFGSAGGR